MPRTPARWRMRSARSSRSSCGGWTHVAQSLIGDGWRECGPCNSEGSVWISIRPPRLFRLRLCLPHPPNRPSRRRTSDFNRVAGAGRRTTGFPSVAAIATCSHSPGPRDSTRRPGVSSAASTSCGGRRKSASIRLVTEPRDPPLPPFPLVQALLGELLRELHPLPFGRQPLIRLPRGFRCVGPVAFFERYREVQMSFGK